jgi:hypothetical protein
MGCCWKSHPAFGYRDEMKSCLKLMMGKEHEDIAYALFPKKSICTQIRRGQADHKRISPTDREET